VGVAHVLGQVAPLFLMCDPRDIAVWPEIKSTFGEQPTVYMYDRVPGGTGLSRRLFEIHLQLLGDAAGLVSACPCVSGCPSCIGPQYESGRNAKLAVLQLIAVLIDEARVSAPMRSLSNA